MGDFLMILGRLVDSAISNRQKFNKRSTRLLDHSDFSRIYYCGKEVDVISK